MKNCVALLAALAVSFGATMVSAEELKSGLAAGEKIPAFYVTKIAGAPEDGVKEGAELCYRCKNGARPQVMVFTKSTGEAVASLSKQLNEAISKNADAQLTGFVNVMNADKATAEKSAKELAAKVADGKLPVVVPVENENGPANYGINPDAEVTVLIANKSTVVASHGYAAGKFDAAAVKAIIAEVEAAIK
jgi:hypothetical protein